MSAARIIALCFTLLLAACGGGDCNCDPSADHQTPLRLVRSAGGSVALASAGGTGFVPAAADSWSNTGATPVTIEVHASVIRLRFASGSTLQAPDDFVSATLVLALDGVPWRTVAIIDSSTALLAPDAASPVSASASASIAVPPGSRVDLVVYIGGGVDIGPARIAWDGAELQSEGAAVLNLTEKSAALRPAAHKPEA